MVDSPDIVVAQVIEAGGLGWTRATDLFEGPRRVKLDGFIPGEACFCLLSGGAGPLEDHDGSLPQPNVQVRVRSELKDGTTFADGQTKARAIRKLLHRADLRSYGYMNAWVDQSEPFSIGEDDSGCPEWTINVRVLLDETA